MAGFGGSAGTATGTRGAGGFGGIVSSAKGQLSSLGQLFGIQGGGVFSNPGGGVFAGGGLGSKLGSIGHSTGTALLGAGLAYDGLRRGGFGGLAETTAGGALIGFKFGGPIGAAIGAGVGALAGTARLFIKGFDQQTREAIKSRYQVDVKDKGVLSQIVGMIKQSYGGSISLGISSPQIRDFIESYALNTKQNFGFQDKPRNINLTDVGGSLSQSASYQNGISYGLAGGTVPISGQVDRTVARPAAINVVVHNNTSISGEDVGALLEGRQIQTINNNPRIVQQAAVAASQTNSNRQSQARLGLSPFALTS